MGLLFLSPQLPTAGGNEKKGDVGSNGYEEEEDSQLPWDLPASGTADAEIKDPSVGNPDLKGSPYKA